MSNKIRLSPGNYYRLFSLVADKYVEKGLGDREFAIWASDILSLPMHDSHVATARTELGISAHNRISGAKELERRVEDCEIALKLNSEEIARLWAKLK